MKEVLPAPLGPISPTICPRSTETVRSATANTPPYRTEMDLASNTHSEPVTARSEVANSLLTDMDHLEFGK